MIRRIISGGQTGVDRGALDAARTAGIACGGWCPKGRRAEDGRIPDVYPLEETERTDYAERTERNVLCSDATLILSPSNRLAGGTALTKQFAERHNKPVLVVELDEKPNPNPVIQWLRDSSIEILNVAGPRESFRPGIAEQAKIFVSSVLAAPGLAEK